ncbi:MAG: hypothetical protein D6732_07440 [Methanobacteriota archaeon]|nr:MAG: hypothetical protein D6732_07440 [Euryarchaeota archaeon]
MQARKISLIGGFAYGFAYLPIYYWIISFFMGFRLDDAGIFAGYIWIVSAPIISGFLFRKSIRNAEKVIQASFWGAMVYGPVTAGVQQLMGWTRDISVELYLALNILLAIVYIFATLLVMQIGEWMGKAN